MHTGILVVTPHHTNSHHSWLWKWRTLGMFFLCRRETISSEYHTGEVEPCYSAYTWGGHEGGTRGRSSYLHKLMALGTQQDVVQFFVFVAIQTNVNDMDWLVGCHGSRKLIGWSSWSARITANTFQWNGRNFLHLQISTIWHHMTSWQYMTPHDSIWHVPWFHHRRRHL